MTNTNGGLLKEKLVNIANTECKVAGWTFTLSRIYSSVDTLFAECVHAFRENVTSELDRAGGAFEEFHHLVQSLS